MIYSKIKRVRLNDSSNEMTLRDKFALSAPACPEWFEVDATALGPKPEEPEWNRFINNFDYKHIEVETDHRKANIRVMTREQILNEKRNEYLNEAHKKFSYRKKMYVDWVNDSNILREQQWSWFYADEMIKGR